MPAAVKALFARKLLKKVAEAYGRMLLVKGLFQADCHPGNILIRDDNGLGMLLQEMGQPVCHLCRLVLSDSSQSISMAAEEVCGCNVLKSSAPHLDMSLHSDWPEKCVILRQKMHFEMSPALNLGRHIHRCTTALSTPRCMQA